MISVIVPTYNRPHLIRSSVESILDQTVQDVEVIIVDGSTDELTRHLMERIKDRRISYKKVKNRSAACSRNIGLDMAKGKFIAFNDDDDIWLPQKLQHQLDFLSDHPGCHLCFCSFEKNTGGKKKIIPGQDIEPGCRPLFQKLLFKNFVGLPTLLFDQSISKGLRFDETLTCLEDWDFILSLTRRNRLGYLNEALVLARDTPGSVNKSSYARKAASYKRIYSKYRSEIHKDHKIQAKHLLSIGSNLVLSGEQTKGQRYILRAAKLNPLSPIMWLAFFSSCFGTTVYQHIFSLFEKITHREP